MGKIGGLESDNVINMIKVRLHASHTHSSLPKIRRNNQMVAAATKVAWPVNATAMYPLQIVIIRPIRHRSAFVGLDKVHCRARRNAKGGWVDVGCQSCTGG